ncbi:c-type cytochrome [Roseobacter sp. HKCCD9010]|uniref:c-type cytochrome n=1 Tax=unclassified Roseobacter TaxID=196798 RepID=UPI001491B3A9|nr:MULTISPECIES: c-type cytochrome [unclassified Roseobacter]MBF9049855.1 c-type cytochrome [Rhodobacterales bacterium HKCCD4356]NNV13606.1 c-type cytochrome [Roseobacter sp. HKCCD7357]NNV16440.1 c-type cytochrome [Roseobacter sp. HKCCD8768]NNV25899.1 c-type cytochrome [Roseobacter sp. HKCCD8192]NNV30157.1 c-type cytochrome [Roseobacter sp. HKCCD9061]
MLARAFLSGAFAVAVLALPGQAADRTEGEVLFRPCGACHMIGEGAVHRVGPHLNGLFGRPIGGAEGYDYSDDLIAARDRGVIWSEELLDRFLAGPRDTFRQTSMVFRGIRSPEDRAALIGYLRAESGTSESQNGAEPAAIDPEIAAILEITGDVAYGAYLSSECTACHRATGGEDIPSIAGMAPSVFIAGIVAYRNGTREHQVMNTLSARLGDEEIAALAAYFETTE